MNGPIRQVAMAVFVAFALVIASATYVQAVRGPEYRDDPRNGRLIAGRTGRERGTIITADGVVVAESVPSRDDSRLFTRHYPEGELYGHIVGYTSLLFGTIGLERERSGVLVSNRDATISGVLRALLGGDLRPRGIRLTIDDALQRVAAEALGEQRGAVVALDPDTGAILAMVSRPGYDPNTLLGADSGPAGDALEADPNQPLLDRAIDETYAPGSTFKIVTAASALESGTVSAGSTFPDPLELELPGSTSTIRNFDRDVCIDGTQVTLEQAFVRSCNTIFAMLGLQLGAEPLVDMAESLGFNQDVPFDLDVVPSAIPPSDSFEHDLPGVAQSAIGQRDVRATPLQMALIAAAVANEGEIMTPHLVAEVFNSDAGIEDTIEPETWRKAMSPATAEAITDLMERVVTSGTGGRAAVPGVRIAGKTGTAQVPDAAPHAWFVGFGPVGADEGTSRIVIAVLVEAGGEAGEDATGGAVAAPIARAVFSQFFGVR
jgi:penicillin-binding protein A